MRNFRFLLNIQVFKLFSTRQTKFKRHSMSPICCKPSVNPTGSNLQQINVARSYGTSFRAMRSGAVLETKFTVQHFATSKYYRITTNVMHTFLIYLSTYFCLTCFGLSISPSSEAGVQLRQWF
jgi:hypothetical protein